MSEPFIWICLVAASTEGDADPDPRIRAWTANGARAAQLVEQGLDMVPVYRNPPARSSADSDLVERLRAFVKAESKDWHNLGTGKLEFTEVTDAGKLVQ